MDKEELSLKNIYRIFTQRDYPDYSTGILRERDKKGLTVLRFWEEVIPYEWRSGQYGRMIWDQEGPRSRYSSELINRRPQFPYYQGYLAEILSALTPEMFLQQLRLFTGFLTRKHYQSDLFRKKIRSFLNLIRTGDPFYNKEIDGFFDAYERENTLPRLFLDGWILTALSLHAAAGPEMAGGELGRMRTDRAFLPSELYRLARKSSGGKQHRLTRAGSALLGKPVSSFAFFGRERELFDLMELLRAGRKVLLSGIGGLGKTEILRQLMKEVTAGDDFQAVGEIQFENSLAESFARAFPESSDAGPRERFHEILYSLSHEDYGKTLLLMDNAVISEDEKELWKELSEIPAAVIVSSRSRQAEGFETYHLEPVSPEAALLMFRSHYKTMLSPRDQQLLLEALKREELRHPLSLSILGRAARYNHWNTGQILEKINDRPGSIHWDEEGTEYQVQKICARLYSDRALSGEEKRLAYLMALLPYGPWPGAFLSEIRNGSSAARHAAKTEGLLEQLYLKGWLDTQDGFQEAGYSMHPLIAETLLRTRKLDNDFQIIGKWAGERIPRLELARLSEHLKEKPAALRESRILFHAAGLVKTSLSSEMLSLCLSAAWQLLRAREAGENFSQDIRQLAGRCSEASWEQRALVQVLTCLHEDFQPEEVRACIEEGLAEEKTAELLAGLCLATVPRLAEMKNYRDFAAATVRRLLTERDSSELRMLDIYLSWSEAMDQGDAVRMIRLLENMRDQLEKTDSAALPLVMKVWTNTVFLLFTELNSPEEGRRLYEEYRQQNYPAGSTEQEVLELRMEAARERAEGSSEKAIESMRRMIRVLERHAGKKSRTYRIALNDLAFYLNECGYPREALTIYEEQIAESVDSLMNAEYLPMILNNAGAAWFRVEEYAKARERFLEANRLAREAGSEMLSANTAYWLSRICQVEGDLMGEKKYLQEAAGFFRQFPEQERGEYIARRLEELK